MASPTLHSDIITDILSRLPSKTLIRFKSVSKQWYSLINSPYFINLHLSQTLISQNSPNFIVSQSSIFSFAISDEPDPNFHLIELDHPLKHLCKAHKFSGYDLKPFPQILGSINGVVCISMCNKSSVVLYNPSTKTHRFIPPFTPSPNTNPHFEINREGTTINVVLFGFGFDSVSGDYKLLRMIETRTISTLLYREASVYSLRNDSWKCVNDQTMMGQFIRPSGRVVCINDQTMMGQFIRPSGRVVCVNEGLHFIVVDTMGSNCKVKCFNLRTETFSIFDLPKFDGTFEKVTCVMSDLGGCFNVLLNYEYMNEFVLQADLWVMKEYGNKESWFRLFSIRDLDIMLFVSIFLRPVVYSSDKKRVLLELDARSFGWYSWSSDRFERIAVHVWPCVDAPCETWTFVDSLVSLGKDKDKLKPKKIKNKDNFLSSGFKLRL